MYFSYLIHIFLQTSIFFIESKKNTKKKKFYEWMRGEKNIVIKIMNIPCLVEIYQIIRGFMFRSFCCSSIAKKNRSWKKNHWDGNVSFLFPFRVLELHSFGWGSDGWREMMRRGCEIMWPSLCLLYICVYFLGRSLFF